MEREKVKLSRLKTKRGFTMVELLGSIVILGILTTISITGIQGIMAKAKEKYYESQEQAIVAAARNFVEKNKQYLPKLNGSITNISLKTIVEAKYIDKVVDYSKKACSNDESFVQIFNYDNDFYYIPYLKCESWHSKEINNSQDINISFDFSGNASTALLKYTVEDQTNGLATYYYSIYSDDKLVFTSERYMVKTNKVEKTIELTDYTPGEIKVVITGVSQKGLSNTESDKHNYAAGGAEDIIKCGLDIQGASTTWTTGTRTVSINCVTGTNGIKCARERFTKEFTTSIEKGNIIISDTEGNARQCPVDVYIDKDAPTVTGVSAATRATGYNSRNIRVTVSGKDTVSGLKSLCYSLSNNVNNCVWKSVSGKEATATWDITLAQSDGSGATQRIYAFAKDNADNVSTVQSTSYTLYTFCSQMGGFKCGKSGNPNVGYYTDVDNVCNQPGTNNGWGLKKVDCPYFDKYFPTHQCSRKERRACPCDTWDSNPATLNDSTNRRKPECNWLYCRDDICKPEFCFNTAYRGDPRCKD